MDAAIEALTAIMEHPDARNYVMEFKKKYGEFVWCINISILWVADVCQLAPSQHNDYYTLPVQL